MAIPPISERNTMSNNEVCPQIDSSEILSILLQKEMEGMAMRVANQHKECVETLKVYKKIIDGGLIELPKVWDDKIQKYRDCPLSDLIDKARWGIELDIEESQIAQFRTVVGKNLIVSDKLTVTNNRIYKHSECVERGLSPREVSTTHIRVVLKVENVNLTLRYIYKLKDTDKCRVTTVEQKQDTYEYKTVTCSI